MTTENPRPSGHQHPESPRAYPAPPVHPPQGPVSTPDGSTVWPGGTHGHDPYGSGPYGSGAHSAEAHPSGAHPAGAHSADMDVTGPYPAGTYATGVHRAGPGGGPGGPAGPADLIGLADPAGPAAPAGPLGPGGYAGFGTPAPSPEPHRRRRSARTLIATCALVAALVGGGSAALVSGLTGGGDDPGRPTPVQNAASRSAGVTAVAQAVSPSIVEIKAATSGGRSTGSGVIVSANGEVITNNHVVAGADTVQVTLHDGTTKNAKVVGTDPGKDLALLKIDGANGLKPAKLGDSGKLQVGDQVVAIGSPEGLTGTVTSGIVSALNREVTVPKEQGGGQGGGRQRGNGPQWPFEFGGEQYNGDTGSSKTTYKAIQTDASLNPGNSGGALINMNGEIVGINSAMFAPGSGGGGGSSDSAGSVGLGFAIPVNDVKADLAGLRAGGSGD
ncbi:S1C family serine protease [Streptomyces huiliensis]|uniref:S1C family serine protease n=1 Tax=Streptomyces huiliensis TaxID=2876027 RepID=UPI001CBE6CCB|nr:trypsin-like peptidase domain-containing protein [Streptomyces huiliensis]MBZ4319179.1 trypsin-like peptidase domain-containing protein [Streptomyces huiliensis]